MRPSIRAAAAALALGGLIATPALAQLQAPRVSPVATVSQTVGVTELSVKYSRPGVKGRTIWGALVPYGQPWRTGANEATTFTASTAVTFGGKPLAAGTYALLTIPTPGEWTVVLSAQTDMWGASGYDSTKDVLRLTVKPGSAPAQEWMEFSFEDLTPSSANLVLRWAELSLAVSIAVDVNATFLATATTAISNAKPGDWRTAYIAARYCFDNKTSLPQGWEWLNRSLGIEKTYSNLALLARWQAADGDLTQAIATGERAVALGQASPDKPDMSGLQKQIAEWRAAK